MHEDGSVDYPSLRKLIDWHVAEGTNCIGVVGTTGESPTVNVEEHCEIIRVSVEQAAGRVPVMAGCGANSTHEAIELAKYAKKVGADSQLQVVPYYNKPTQEGQYQHFKAIAEAVGDLPMMLYNVPGRSVADMQHDTVLRLAQIDGIFGIKEATGNIERAQWLIRDVPRLWRVLRRRPHRRGADAAGRPRQCQRHRQRGPAPDERAVQGRAGRRCEARHGHPVQADAPAQKPVCGSQPHPVKWAVARMGLCGATMRLPMTPLSANNQAVVETALRDAGLL
jgi:4-hydroxy-tetrahydrodipicolinate synthase